MQPLGKLNSFKFMLYIAICALCSVCFVACGPQSVVKTTKAPSAQFSTLTGQKFDTSNLRGKVILVNFWATSCTTCVHEMPMLVQQFTQHQTQGYRHIAVAMDYDPIAFVKNFSTERALPFDVVHDTDGSIAKAFGNIKLTPTSFLIDRQGNIVKRYVGAPKEIELKAAIESLLNQS